MDGVVFWIFCVAFHLLRVSWNHTDVLGIWKLLVTDKANRWARDYPRCVLHAVIKYHDLSKLRKRGLILACGSRGLNSIMAEKTWHVGGWNSMRANQIFIHTGSLEKKQKVGQDYKPSKPITGLQWHTYFIKTLILKGSITSSICVTTVWGGEHMVKYRNLWGTFLIQAISEMV